MMHKIKMLCFDSNPEVEPYEDTPLISCFSTEEEAYAKALELAEKEAEELNDGCDDDVSFGVVEDETDNSVRVLYYHMDGPTDTTGNTEQVTTYWVEKVNEEKRLKEILDACLNWMMYDNDDVAGTLEAIHFDDPSELRAFGYETLAIMMEERIENK